MSKSKTILVASFAIIVIGIFVVANLDFQGISDEPEEYDPDQYSNDRVEVTDESNTDNDSSNLESNEQEIPYVNGNGDLKIGEMSEEELVNYYESTLESLTIGEQKISVGEWDIRESDGRLFIEAESPTEEALEQIFTMYDNGNIEPIREWGKEVAQLTKEIESYYNQPWFVDAGGNCMSVYPKSLPNSILSGYAGSCGYSIPVLDGDSEDGFYLMVEEKLN
ncbi:hypothetical protein [Alkalibacillus flavidus]|uniref:hypothetical protein n=1 Tax=Alkalibacillus flavidus TaxID=546021 RepID=UPI0036700806